VRGATQAKHAALPCGASRNLTGCRSSRSQVTTSGYSSVPTSGMADDKVSRAHGTRRLCAQSGVAKSTHSRGGVCPSGRRRAFGTLCGLLQRAVHPFARPGLRTRPVSFTGPHDDRRNLITSPSPKPQAHQGIQKLLTAEHEAMEVVAAAKAGASHVARKLSRAPQTRHPQNAPLLCAAL
jgi:hypothetical protein